MAVVGLETYHRLERYTREVKRLLDALDDAGALNENVMDSTKVREAKEKARDFLLNDEGIP